MMVQATLVIRSSSCAGSAGPGRHVHAAGDSDPACQGGPPRAVRKCVLKNTVYVSSRHDLNRIGTTARMVLRRAGGGNTGNRNNSADR